LLIAKDIVFLRMKRVRKIMKTLNIDRVVRAADRARGNSRRGAADLVHSSSSATVDAAGTQSNRKATAKLKTGATN
jgi:hypothetical protein